MTRIRRATVRATCRRAGGGGAGAMRADGPAGGSSKPRAMVARSDTTIAAMVAAGAERASGHGISAPHMRPAGAPTGRAPARKLVRHFPTRSTIKLLAVGGNEPCGKTRFSRTPECVAFCRFFAPAPRWHFSKMATARQFSSPGVTHGAMARSGATSASDVRANTAHLISRLRTSRAWLAATVN